jgi:hypothetical protein
MESVIGQSPRASSKCTLSLDLETFTDALFGNSLNSLKPMNKFLQKDQPFIWDDAAQQAFNKMKKHFTKEPALMMLDQT